MTSFSLIAYLLIIGWLLIGAWIRPATAAAAFLCMFALDHWGASQIPFLYNHSWVTNFAVALVMATGVARQIRSRSRRKFEPNYTQILLILLLCYAAASTLWSPFEGAIGLWSNRWEYLALGSLLLPFLFNEPEDFSALRKQMVIIGSVLCALLVVVGEWENRQLLVWFAPGMTIKDPLNIALTGGFLLLSAAFSWRGKPIAWQVLRWVAIVAALALVVTSSSRGQFVFMLLVALLLAPVSERMKNSWTYIRVVVAMGLILGIAFWIFEKDGVSIARWQLDRMTEDFEGRFKMAARLLSAWSVSPLSIVFGLGNSAAFDSRIAGFYPHIVPLEILGEEGLIGATIFLIVLLRSAFRLKSAFVVSKYRPQWRADMTTCAGYALFTLLLSLKQGSLLSSAYLIGCLVLLERLSTIYLMTGKERFVAKPSPNRAYLLATKSDSDVKLEGKLTEYENILR